ncbi:Uncharacterized protein APZ42_026907 [Daphnia magna]|uniref:Uncharacterized protein n=1 Tax=Daphnia magna TaxID=35525 RepID=A0A164RVV0_9CRUS|nr:Uncharacterized protein APZ42_026907 [Daphnia magna]
MLSICQWKTFWNFFQDGISETPEDLPPPKSEKKNMVEPMDLNCWTEVVERKRSNCIH